MSGKRGMVRTAEHNEAIAAAHRAKGVGSTPTKQCPRCGETKPRGGFPRRKNGYSESRCWECLRVPEEEKARRKRERNAEKTRRHVDRTPHLRARRQATARRTTLRKYGPSVALFDAMVRAQGGVCATCGLPPKRGSLHVDHDHATGRVRGLLCNRCNLGVGNFQDDPSLLRSAAEYLER